MSNTKWKRTRAVVFSGMSFDDWRSAADIRFRAIRPLSSSCVRKHLKDMVDFGFGVRKPERGLWLFIKTRKTGANGN